MRHRTSASLLAISGAGALTGGLALIAMRLDRLGTLAGTTGVDAVGFNGATSDSATDSGQTTATQLPGECLDPDAYDYDCAGGSGAGPNYTGLRNCLSGVTARTDCRSPREGALSERPPPVSLAGDSASGRAPRAGASRRQR